jgi:hypothetical protein
MQWLLEIVLIGLLAATLFHALRLERALGVLKRDRSVLEGLVASFNASTRQAEAGVERLHVAAEGAGRTISRQAEMALALKDDLVFLMERGDGLADRLDALVRTAKSLAAAEPHLKHSAAEPHLKHSAAEPHLKHSAAEPHLKHSGVEPRYQSSAAELRNQYDAAEPRYHQAAAEPRPERSAVESAVTARSAAPRSERGGAAVLQSDLDVADKSRVRSQAERDLLRALRLAR